jgi:hypothetical protein
MNKDIVAYMQELLKEVNRIYAQSEHKPSGSDYSMYDYKLAILIDLFEADDRKMPREKFLAYSELERYYKARGSWN